MKHNGAAVQGKKRWGNRIKLREGESRQRGKICRVMLESNQLLIAAKLFDIKPEYETKFERMER